LSIQYRSTKALAAERGFHRTLDLEIFMADDVLVSVIDDDESVRESIPDLLRTFGFHVRAFDSAEAFLGSDVIEVTRCVVLDVAMPGMSGPELFERLKQRPKALPVIFITAQRNGDLCQRLVARGAAACLYKPFDPMALVGAVKHVVPWN
jgi:FixJ family two-component response regulator